MNQRIDRERIAPTPALDQMLKRTLGDNVNLRGERDRKPIEDKLLTTGILLPPSLARLAPRLDAFERGLIQDLRRDGVAVFPMNTAEAVAWMMAQGSDRLLVVAKNQAEQALAATTPGTNLSDNASERRVGFSLAAKDEGQGKGLIISPDLNAKNFRSPTFDARTAIIYIAGANGLRAVREHAVGEKVPIVTEDHLVGAQVLADDTLEAHHSFKAAQKPAHEVDNRKVTLVREVSSSKPYAGEAVGEGLIWDPAEATESWAWGKGLPYYGVLLPDLVTITQDGRLVMKSMPVLLQEIEMQDPKKRKIDPLADIQRMGYAALLAKNKAGALEDEIYKRAEGGLV